MTMTIFPSNPFPDLLRPASPGDLKLGTEFYWLDGDGIARRCVNKPPEIILDKYRTWLLTQIKTKRVYLKIRPDTYLPEQKPLLTKTKSLGCPPILENTNILRGSEQPKSKG